MLLSHMEELFRPVHNDLAELAEALKGSLKHPRAA